MSEGIKKDPFLEDLQRQCLIDAKDRYEEFLAALSYFQTDTKRSLAALSSLIHTVKGNLQAAGFLHYAEMLHQLESAVGRLEKKIANEWKLSSEDYGLIEFFLSDVQFNLVDYANELMKELDDKEQMYLRRKGVIDNLGSWDPAAATSNSPSEPAISHQLPEVIAAPIDHEPKSQPQVENSERQEKQPVKSIKPAKPESQMYFLCGNHGQKFAVPIQYVVEILQIQPMTKLPTSRKDIVGLVNLRGDAIPVLNLDFLLGARNQSRYIVICKIDNYHFAFEVEDAEQVIHLSEESFQQIDQSPRAETGTWDKVLTHLSMMDNKAIFILNLDQLVAA